MCSRSTGKNGSSPNGAKDTEHEVTRRVRLFYERFKFPGIRPVDQDGLILMRHVTRNVARYSGRTGKRRMRILDAGCGTGNTVISLARRFREEQFVGVDISAPSLEIGRKEASGLGLENLRFVNWDLMERGLDAGPFDMVLCLGVLHHTASMAEVLANLGRVMEEDGQLILWIYGLHGRYRHALNQRLLGLLLGGDCDEEAAIDAARDFAVGFGNHDALEDLFGRGVAESVRREVIDNRAWVADQYLHPRETLLDMESLLALIESAGLCLKHWLGVPGDIPEALGSGALRDRFEGLEGKDRLVAMDLILKPDRYFVVLERDV